MQRPGSAIPAKIIIGILTLAMFCNLTHCQPGNADRKVFIKREGAKYTLYRNGAPYIIKGAAGYEHLEQLHAAGGNTIRVWDTLHLGEILDKAHANNIAVIAGLPMPVSGIFPFYNNASKVAAQYKSFSNIVTRYRSHPALLMWCLGNEIDFPYKPRYNNFYRTYSRLLKMIHKEDPDHPVTTSLTNFERRCLYNIRLRLPQLDLVSFNTFGSLHSLQNDLNKFSWFWDGPFLITEWGVHGPWEASLTAWKAPIELNSTVKAEQYLERYEQSMPTKDPRFLGSCVFFWGSKQEVTHTWFNLFDSSGASSEIVNVMKYIWSGKRPVHKAPEISHMLLQGLKPKDNIILNSNTVNTAVVFLKHSDTDSLRVQWEILEEDWYVKNWYETSKHKPTAYDSLLITFDGHQATFRAPIKEGPYRIFATFFDNKGYFASTNTPFYVVER